MASARGGPLALTVLCGSSSGECLLEGALRGEIALDMLAQDEAQEPGALYPQERGAASSAACDAEPESSGVQAHGAASTTAKASEAGAVAAAVP